MGNSQVSMLPKDLIVIVRHGIVCQWWWDPTLPDGAVGRRGRGGHSVGITNRRVWVCVEAHPSWEICGQWVDHWTWCRLEAFAHPCNGGVGHLENLLHILKFDVVSGGNLVLICRDSFCGTAKIDLEGGAFEVLCFYYFVNEVDYHTGGGDQQET